MVAASKTYRLLL